jgi:hypothetical protein
MLERDRDTGHWADCNRMGPIRSCCTCCSRRRCIRLRYIRLRYIRNRCSHTGRSSRSCNGSRADRSRDSSSSFDNRRLKGRRDLRARPRRKCIATLNDAP